MTNLLKETMSVMEEEHLFAKDIVYIGDGESSCTWEEFCTIADVEYDSSYGCVKIIMGLTIVFNNGVELHRGEYDGSEWWDVHIPFNLEKLPPQKKLKSVKHGGNW